MPNLNPIGWIDVYDLACSLRSRLSEFQGTGTRTLPVRGPRQGGDADDEYAFIESRRPMVRKWVELDAVRRKLDDAATARIGGGVDYGRIFLEMLDPEAHIALRRDTRHYAARHLRLVVCIRSNPGCFLWCPPEQLGLVPGQIILTSAGLLQAAVNLGDTPRINLIIDVKQKITTSAPHEDTRFAAEALEEETAC
jgi:hypothetical protein